MPPEFTDHETPDRGQRPAAGPWLYEQQQLGFNYRITDLQAALGLSQLGNACTAAGVLQGPQGLQILAALGWGEAAEGLEHGLCLAVIRAGWRRLAPAGAGAQQ